MAVIYGVQGIRRFKRQDVALFSTPNMSYMALVGIGIFSSVYHSTLKYHTQMGRRASRDLQVAVTC